MPPLDYHGLNFNSLQTNPLFHDGYARSRNRITYNKQGKYSFWTLNISMLY